ncbi:hypothetical protein O181_045378 [Austropuccinia psidii MF-1]|uniref:Uncharacterized protein n=1 Tax=Austropuccinia psidii MF-1 TaxID=1389203 RepID=A0A9Q3DRY9_9BASI|nr:hypothetical protein [Austropuccinia psidii MF-1]
MTPDRSESNYSIQSNGSRPGHSSEKSKIQEFQPRGKAQMEDVRTSTSSQRLDSTFDTLIESPEAEITAIPVVRPESFLAGSNRDIPVSVQELVYGGKAAGVGTSAKLLDRQNELLSSSEESHGPRKNRRTSEGLNTHVLQGTSPTDKSLVEKPKHVVRGPEEELAQGKRTGKWKFPKPPQAKIRLNKRQTMTSKPQRAIRKARKKKMERQNPSGTSLTHRITESPKRRRQPWRMCSIWQELLWNSKTRRRKD